MKRPRGTGRAQVKTLIDDYRREFSSRFRDMRGDVRSAVVDERRFHPSAGGSNPNGERGPPMTDGGMRAHADGFEFDTRADREDAFNSWLADMIDADLLEPMDSARVRSGDHYTAPYIRTAYDRGLKYANGASKARGMDLPIPTAIADAETVPRHRETLKLLYTRNYKQLEGVSSHTEQTLSRLMSESFMAGHNPRKTARILNSELTDIRRSRAEVLARTEFMNAHTQATAESYQAHGIEKADVLTAGDSRVCAQCKALAAGNPYPVAEIRTILPAHPQCRCSIAPVVSEQESAE